MGLNPELTKSANCISTMALYPFIDKPIAALTIADSQMGVLRPITIVLGYFCIDCFKPSEIASTIRILVVAPLAGGCSSKSKGLYISANSCSVLGLISSSANALSKALLMSAFICALMSSISSFVSSFSDIKNCS